MVVEINRYRDLEPRLLEEKMYSITARRAGRLTAFSLLATMTIATAAHAAGEVNIYSYRQPVLIEPMLKAFTKKTGIKTNTVYAKKGIG